MLEHGSMPELHAKRLLLNIDHACIVNREQIVECLAALVRLFPDEIKKQAPDGRRLHAILVSFAAPARLEWVLNFRRARQHIVRKDVDFLATGTTSNESLHREMNRAFDQVHAMYRETLRLRLAIFLIYKLLPHNRAQYGRGLRARRQGLMMNLCVNSMKLWTESKWRSWCRTLGKRDKASIPLAKARAKAAGLVRAHVRQRPASAVDSILRRPATSLTSLQPSELRELLKRPAAELLGRGSRGPRKRTPFRAVPGKRAVAYTSTRVGGSMVIKRPSTVKR